MAPTPPSAADRIDAFHHPHFPSLPSSPILSSTGHTLAPRAPTFVAIPSTYGAQSSSPSPGVVAGIVLGSVAGFLFLLFLIYSALGFGPAVIPYRRGDTTTVASQSVISFRTRDKSRRRRPVRATETYEVRTRERVVSVEGRPAIVVEPRRAPARDPPPPPRVVPDDDSDDEIIVEEEHSPPRRTSRRESRGRYSDYRDGESRGRYSRDY